MDECIIWKGKTRSNGRYGYFSENGKIVSAHRYACTIGNGLPPTLTALACHRCNNSLCVNPKHLYWGTPSTNYADSRDVIIAALLPQDGYKNRNCKKSKEDFIKCVNRCKELRSLGKTYRQIRDLVGLKSPGHVRQLCIREYGTD